MNTTQKNTIRGRQEQTPMTPLTQFDIYEDLNLICNKVFNKSQITIGSSRKADLCLEHDSVESIHALVHFNNDQAFLTNNFPQNGLRLNGRSVGLSQLLHEDVIDIGPFSLKIKMPEDPSPSRVEQDNAYAVRLVNRYATPQSMEAAARQLSKIMRAEPEKTLPMLAREHYILKKGLSGFKAAQIQNALLKAGVICDVQIMESQPADVEEKTVAKEKFRQPSEPQPVPKVQRHCIVTRKVTESTEEIHRPSNVDAAVATKAEDQKAEAASASIASDEIEEISKSAVIEVPFTEIYEDEADEDEEDIWQAPFSLKTELEVHSGRQKDTAKLSGKKQLRIIKTIGGSVVDVRYLQGRQKYYVDTDQGAIALVDAKPRGDHYVSILPTFTGYIRSSAGVTTADLNSYKTTEFLKRTKKTLYRIPMPQNDTLVIEMEGSCYQITSVQPHPTAQVTTVEHPSEFSWRHWATSAGVHFFLLLCLSVYTYFQAAVPEMSGPHFVKIDPAMLQKMDRPKEPRKPKEISPPAKPEPMKVADKVKPPKNKPVQKKKTPANVAKKRMSKKKLARSKGASRHPKAGGGFGEGNIKNRNINQAGILSVLGSSSIGGPSQAIAAVTNLDAVAVPGATEKNFSVGGVKGALGNGKIAVATGGAILQTKGSKQVLRSAGARGKGEVAALERGSTGRKQVQAMVSAKIDRSVKIEGGMSRAMVKRVIDQHLDEITYCYETALMTQPNIMGRMVFEWKILMNGRVGEIRIVASSVNSKEIHSCIRSAIKSWQFPKPVGTPVMVSYPFVFDLVTF